MSGCSAISGRRRMHSGLAGLPTPPTVHLTASCDAVGMVGATACDFCHGLLHPGLTGPNLPGPKGFRDMPIGIDGLYLGGTDCRGGPGITFIQRRLSGARQPRLTCRCGCDYQATPLRSCSPPCTDSVEYRSEPGSRRGTETKKTARFQPKPSKKTRSQRAPKAASQRHRERVPTATKMTEMCRFDERHHVSIQASSMPGFTRGSRA